MGFLKLSTSFQDPESRDLEIVERKGIGHPDNLADALAESVSIAYSKYCLEQFGVVLHHNVDKLYIGAGQFKSEFGICKMLKPIQVRVNGRMSNSFADKTFNIKDIQRKAILPYLLSTLPHLKEDEVVIHPNATQNTRIPHWFSPRSKEDLPEYQRLRANDTSVCVSHWPMTTSERLTYEIEKHFWEMIDGFPVPKFEYFGQDIKVMTLRKEDTIDITVCLPVISTTVSSLDDYKNHIRQAEDELNNLAQKIVHETKYSVHLEVNPYRFYMLGIGSCIECGEEGIVGRGNSNNGVISVFRPNSVEAWAGKNPIYHTGRVLGFLTLNLAKALYQELGVKCTVVALTKNSNSLIPPHLLSIETDEAVELTKIKTVVDSNFINVDYLKKILSERQIK